LSAFHQGVTLAFMAFLLVPSGFSVVG